MAVTVTWVEFNGTTAAAGQGTGLATNLNFGSIDSIDLTTASNPIAAGSNSYVKYWKAQWSGSFSTISNAKLYKSAGDYLTGESIKFSGTYAKSGAPSQTTLPAVGANAVPVIPTSLPGSNNIGLPNYPNTTLTLAGYYSSPGYASGARTSMMAFQLQTTSGVAAGPVNQKTVSLTYDRT